MKDGVLEEGERQEDGEGGVTPSVSLVKPKDWDPGRPHTYEVPLIRNKDEIIDYGSAH